jgi:flagellar hook-length control protein FliK
MQISSTGTTPQIQLRLPTQALQGLVLKEGEMLQATVRQSDPSGQLTLEISGKLLQAVSTLRLAAGMTLQLRVERSNDGVTLLLDEPQQKRLMYQQALRQNLPRQESLQPLLQRLAQWQQTPGKSAQPATAVDTKAPNDTSAQVATNTTHPEATTTPLPKSVAQAVTRLLTLLPGLQQLFKAEGLQQAISNSGPFLESHLLQGAPVRTLDSDVKAALLRLAQTIRQYLSEGKPPSNTQTREQSEDGLRSLLRQIESGVARIQSNQLNALTGRGESEERLNLNLELPLFDLQQRKVEVLQIRIRRDGKRGGKNGERWSVTLHLSPQGYGDIRAVVSLSGGKISTTFWCEKEETAQLFREQLHQLQERLKEQGVETAHCSSRCGKPPEEADELATQLSGLIDTQA